MICEKRLNAIAVVLGGGGNDLKQKNNSMGGEGGLGISTFNAQQNEQYRKDM